MDLAELVERLSKYGQRATYAAVGGLIGKPARSVMHGQPKVAKNSWVVSKETGMPTGYGPEVQDSRLAGSPRPISKPEELARWIRDNP